ncbi:MAG: hypothetical protein ACI9BV_003586 [Rhodothermales bacterium]|jgi:hypothetical protein
MPHHFLHRLEKTALFLVLFSATLASSAFAQVPPPNPNVDPAGYETWKNSQASVIPASAPAAPSMRTTGAFTKGATSQSVVSGGLMIPFTGTSGWTALGKNDDGSSPVVDLGFTLDFFGESETQAYVNNNGNVSLGAPYSSYSSSGFPAGNNKMIAPFWADVDTRCANCGEVFYKTESGPGWNRFVAQWQAVGYYNQSSDKVNTFQLILSDGNDPVMPAGKSACFSYGDMQWTTGSASGGINGFGGTPATVGINKGDGTVYFQVGRFDHEGTDFDGSTGANDGVSYLDGTNQCFTTFTADLFDADQDGLVAENDNCPFVANADQINTDGDDQGDACDLDDDNDGLSDAFELGHYRTNPLLADTDGDSVPDFLEQACGGNPRNASIQPRDSDGDGIPDCSETDLDGDGADDAVDDDVDGDGLVNAIDKTPRDASGLDFYASRTESGSIRRLVKDDPNCSDLVAGQQFGGICPRHVVAEAYTITWPYSGTITRGAERVEKVWINTDATGAQIYLNFKAMAVASAVATTCRSTNTGKDSNYSIYAADSYPNVVKTWRKCGSVHAGVFEGEAIVQLGADNSTIITIANGASIIAEELSRSGGRTTFTVVNDGTGGTVLLTTAEGIQLMAPGEPVTITVPTPPDADDDGLQDVLDNCPLVSNGNQADFDADGIGDVCDLDLDGNGELDALNLDNDFDGILDTADNCRFWSNPDQTDTDGDGIGNDCDGDEGNDGQADDLQLLCGVGPSGLATDSDQDGIPDCVDTDNDNDGLSNAEEIALGLDPFQADNDGDGVIDGVDRMPTNAGESFDNDGDGIGDNADPDDDNDGVLDGLDAFPFDGAETADNDADGVGDNADLDDDNDGVEDTEDAFPFDPTETVDTDFDGIGDNADRDDDGNGLPDLKERALIRLAGLSCDNKTGKDVQKAIASLAKSLTPEWWADADHPDSKDGNKVFDEAQHAVNSLEKVIEGGGSCATEAAVSIDDMVAVDALLAQTAIDDATVDCADRKCSKFLDNAAGELAQAEAALAKGDFDHAIERYGKAWDTAIKAGGGLRHGDVVASRGRDEEQDASKNDDGILEANGLDASVMTDGFVVDLPTEFALEGNYPNPFNPTTTIRFALPETAAVSLVVFDLMGRQVQQLIAGTIQAGRHEAKFDARTLPSGTYLYRLSTPVGAFTGRMMLVK